MKAIRMVVPSAVVLGMTVWAGTASAADAAAGKAKFDEICVECHETADHEGKDAAQLTAEIKKIVAGQTKHKKKLQLTDAEIADLVAYILPGG